MPSSYLGLSGSFASSTPTDPSPGLLAYPDMTADQRSAPGRSRTIRRMNVPEFQARWRAVTLTERASAQSHFIDLCRLLDHPTPTEADPDGRFFPFEKGLGKTGGAVGSRMSGTGATSGGSTKQ